MVSFESLEPLLYNENHNFLYISQYSQVIYHKKALIISNLTIYNLIIFNRIAMSFLSPFHKLCFCHLPTFTTASVSRKQPQAATTSILSFRLGFLSNETIFTFLHAPKDEKSSCVPDRAQETHSCQNTALQIICALLKRLC